MFLMFGRCSSLEKLNVSTFNINNKCWMAQMFYKCSSLKYLNLSNFNDITNHNIHKIFDGCSSLKIKCSGEFENKIKNIYPNLFN